MRPIFPDSDVLFAAWVTEEEWEQMAEHALPTGTVSTAIMLPLLTRKTSDMLRMSR